MEAPRFLLATIAATALAGCKGSTPTVDIFTGSPRPPASTPGALGERMPSTSLCVTNDGTPRTNGNPLIVNALETADAELAKVIPRHLDTGVTVEGMLESVAAGDGDVVVYVWEEGGTDNSTPTPLATGVSPVATLGSGETACVQLFTEN